MGRPSRDTEVLDTELEALPPELRWREWMTRIEAVLFAAPTPVPREVLAGLVGRECSLDVLLEDLSAELAARPYEVVAVAGGWQLRTRPSHAHLLRTAFGGATTNHDITPGELVVLAIIAYHQPITRGALAEMLGREVSRDVIGQLRRLDLIAFGPRAPQLGAPYTYVTTVAFLERFGLNTLRELPEIEALEDAGLVGLD